MVGVLIEPDSRNRISLGDLARHDRYIARVDDEGVIQLIPAVVMTVEEFEKLKGMR